jgi:hypothetical protein
MKRYGGFLLGLGVLIGGCGGSGGGGGGGIPDSPITWQQLIISPNIAGLDTTLAGYIILDDFNQDGTLDAASGFASSRAVALHIQDQPEHWTTQVLAENLSAVYSLASADLDHSGLPDIVVATGDAMWVLLSPSAVGPGSSAPWIKSNLPSPISLQCWNDVKIGDFGKQPQLQIVAASECGKSVVFWQAQGVVKTGTDYQPFIIASQANNGFVRMAVADVDADGDLDLVLVGPKSGVIWLENLGGANVTKPWVEHIISSQAGYFRVVTADLDGDGDMDVAATNQANGQVVWFENTGSPKTDSWPVHLVITFTSGVPSALSVGDLDGDKVPDLLVGSSVTNQSIFWFKQFNDPRSPWQPYRIATPGFDVGELPIGLIDKKSGMDFATTLPGSTTPVVWFQHQ